MMNMMDISTTLSMVTTTSSTLSSWRNDITSWLEVVIEILRWTLCVITTIGNVLVLIVFIKDHKLRGNISNLFILNLALADLLVGCMTMPFYNIRQLLPFSEAVCNFLLTVDFSECTISVWAVVLISYDRYVLVTKGLEYDKVQTFSKFVILSTSTRIISYSQFFFAFVGYGWFVPSTIDYAGYCDSDVLHKSSFVIYAMITSNIIPVGLTAYFNARLYADIRRRSRGLPRNWAAVDPETNTSNAESSSSVPDTGIFRRHEGTADIRKHRKAAVTLALIVSVSCLCWTPFFIITFLEVIFGVTVSKRVLNAFVYIFYVNSAINPLLYVATNPRIRHGILGLIKRR